MVSGCNFRLMKDHSTSVCIQDELFQQSAHARDLTLSWICGPYWKQCASQRVALFFI